MNRPKKVQKGGDVAFPRIYGPAWLFSNNLCEVIFHYLGCEGCKVLRVSPPQNTLSPLMQPPTRPTLAHNVKHASHSLDGHCEWSRYHKK